MSEPVAVPEPVDTGAIETARERAGAAIRDLGHAFVGRHMSAEQIDRLSDVLEGISAELWPGVPRRRGIRSPGDDDFAEGRIDQGFSDRPVSGAASPWGLDLDVHRRGDGIEAFVTLRAAHEGAPGRSHGGIVAALFDDVFGFVLGVLRQPAFTGELTVRYLAPTPLHRPLVCRARLVRRDGRKLFVEGELVDVETEQEVARCHALFIAVSADHFVTPTAERPAPPAE
ncbi:MAG TPA: PaaI family thioesterase [Ilumatobacter sp.]|nr:PaaI family thioesterase [Ilumatobacter sp.]